MKDIIIAIDGYSGCGKSSTAKGVAQVLNYKYIDTGAMYRAVTLLMIRKGIVINDLASIGKLLNDIDLHFEFVGNELHLFNKDEDIDSYLRKAEIDSMVSSVSSIEIVRTKLVEQQKKMGQGKGVIIEGRDIATMVFPDAELKIFLTADIKVRAKRRKLELKQKGILLEEEKIINNLKERDSMDTSRKISPLKKATEAILIDTSYISLEEQLKKVAQLAEQKINKQ